MKKKLLFDVDSTIPFFLKGHTTGVGRSTVELVNALEKCNDIPFDLILYSQNTKGIGAKNFNGPLKKLHLYIPRREPFSRIVNSIHLKKCLSGYDLMHIPHNTDTCENIHKTIYTIHDLIVYRYPEMWGLTDKERGFHKYIAENCKAIVTCSKASKDDIIRFWGCPSEKIHVIPWGVNRDMFHPSNEPLDKTLGIKSGEYFFSSSCNHPRKQTSLILDAFNNYRRNSGHHKLVLLGAAENDVAPFNHLLQDNSLIVMRGIDDKTLVDLYTYAKATVVASLFEGFGLPVIESLACHTQVICAKNSSLIEAGGSIVDYIENMSTETLTQKFALYENTPKRNTIDNEMAERHLKNFTWENCAVEYVKMWTKLLADEI